MAEQTNAIALRNLSEFKKMMNTDSIKNKFLEVLKDKAPGFISNVTSIVHNNSSLSKCDPMSIITSAMIAASLNLNLDQNLGFCAIIPFKGKAQFQIMVKGFVQLAIRSGQYKNIHVTDVYEDELEEYDEITGKLQFTTLESRMQRKNKEVKNIIGYYARIEMLNGFIKESFMYNDDIVYHAKKYSPSYSYSTSLWKTDFSSMAKKTVLKLLLKSYGLLSIDMQTAVINDQGTPQDINNMKDIDYGKDDIQVIATEESPLELEGDSDDPN